MDTIYKVQTSLSTTDYLVLDLFLSDDSKSKKHSLVSKVLENTVKGVANCDYKLCANFGSLLAGGSNFKIRIFSKKPGLLVVNFEKDNETLRR